MFGVFGALILNIAECSYCYDNIIYNYKPYCSHFYTQKGEGHEVYKPKNFANCKSNNAVIARCASACMVNIVTYCAVLAARKKSFSCASQQARHNLLPISSDKSPGVYIFV